MQHRSCEPWTHVGAGERPCRTRCLCTPANQPISTIILRLASHFTILHGRSGMLVKPCYQQRLRLRAACTPPPPFRQG